MYIHVLIIQPIAIAHSNITTLQFSRSFNVKKTHLASNLHTILLRIFLELKWSQEEVSNQRNRRSNQTSSYMMKRNTETDIKWSMPYGTAPGIKCLELIVTQQSTLLKRRVLTFLREGCSKLNARRCAVRQAPFNVCFSVM